MTHFLSALSLSGLLLILGCHSAYRTTTRDLGIPNATRHVEEGKVIITSSSDRFPSTFTFTIGKRPSTIDGVCYYLNKAAGHRDLAKEDIRILRQALMTTWTPKPVLNLLIDPGHGGNDSGCRVGEMQEQAITMAVAREVQRLLKERGHNVNLTRPDEATTRTLDERTQLGASLAVDAFVSIHVNASQNPDAKGVETYTIPAFGCEGSLPNSPPRPAMIGQLYLPRATRMAYYVQQQLLTDTTVADRGVRHAHFKVLRNTPAPSILIEIGFLTNAEDYARITNAEQQKIIAGQIADGILKAFTNP